MYRTLAVLVRNRTGVLFRVASLFSRRAYNIESITVGRTETPEFSRMTLVVDEDAAACDQICKQLSKLVDVVRVRDITDEDIVARELALIKVAATPDQRQAIMQMANVFRARVVDITNRTLTVEITGTEDKVDALIGLLQPYGLREVVRTGRIALNRGVRGMRGSLMAALAKRRQAALARAAVDAAPAGQQVARL